MRWQIWTAIGVGVVGLLVVAGIVVGRAETRRAGERRLREAEAALDQSDPGWRLDDILAKRDAARPPDDKNLTKLCQDISAKRSAEFDQWSRDAADWLPVPEVNRVPKPQAVAAARTAFVTADEMVRLARAARTRPTGGWPLVVPDNPLNTNLEHTQRVRLAAHVLQVDALLAALDGDRPRAAAAVANGLHLGHAVGDEPFAVSQLVRAAVAQVACSTLERVMALDGLAAGDLAALEPRLLAEADFPRAAVGERGDRAVAHRVCELVDSGKLPLAKLADLRDSWRERWTASEYRRFLPGDQADLLAHFSRSVEIAGRPAHERQKLLDAIPLPPRDGRHLLSRALSPGLYLTTGSDVRCIAVLRCAAAAAGCERFRLAHGRWPDTLAEAGGPVPLDPYTGDPLRLAKRPDGLTVYATGPDRADDGGALSFDSLPQKGEDIGFRLWDVTARRQPPPPPPVDEWLPALADAMRVAVWQPTGTVVAIFWDEIARTVSEVSQ